jgi:hypothetical protein
MVAHLAKLNPERPALIRHDDDRQAHESGLNNLSAQCQHASKAMTGIADVESKLDNLFHELGEISKGTTVLFVRTDIQRGSRYVARYHPPHLVSH